MTIPRFSVGDELFTHHDSVLCALEVLSVGDDNTYTVRVTAPLVIDYKAVIAALVKVNTQLDGGVITLGEATMQRYQIMFAYQADNNVEPTLAISQRIALHWGGLEGLVSLTNASSDMLQFGGHDDLYQIWLAGSRPKLREDDGRPFTGDPVKKGHVLVNCLTEAPDNWFHVALNGTYDTGFSSGKV